MPHNLYDLSHALNVNNLISLYQQYDGPIWVYEAEIINKRITQLYRFDNIRFAQKACSNINILRLMRSKGVKIDSVSLGEIKRALLAGFQPGTKDDEIIFTADLLDESTITCVTKLNIPVNAGSLDMLIQLGIRSPGHRVWLRINPGFGYGHSKKTNTGGENSKHGIWYTDLPLALTYIDRYNLQLIGLHMHIGSGANYAHLTKVCNAMKQQVINYRPNISAISAGGGLSIPYESLIKEETFNIDNYFNLWNITRQQISQYLGHPIILEIEPGRFLVAESGILITQVRAVKNMGKQHFILVNAGFNDLMRPAMYGSYHHITLLPADGHKYDTNLPLVDTIVGGPLCESGDIFTQTNDANVIPRRLPQARVGDYLVFHDTGAYGASMSSNYNSRPLLPEILFEKGKARQIRRRQLFEELFNLEN